MKRLLALLPVLLLISAVSTVSAQPSQNDIIRQKALRIRDINNARQGVGPPAAAPAPAAPAAPSGPQGINPAQQANIDKLEADLSAIKPGSKVADEQKQQLQEDTLVLAKSIKPSKPLLTNFVNHLSAALAGKGVSLKAPAPADLAKDVNIVVNSLNLTAGQVQPFIVSAQNSLRLAGAPEDNYKAVVADLKAIVAELQKKKPKL